MPILILGLNHQSTSLDMRGRLTISTDELHSALRDLQQQVPDLAEAAILSTCNRVEIHGVSQSGDAEPILNWLAGYKDVPLSEFRESTYHHTGNAAATHAMRVASGLDSQILGEPQIQGQFKMAYRNARECATLGSELSLLEDFALQTAKRIRTETLIGAEPVSVAYATITMAKQIFADFRDADILLVGAGSNIRLIAEYLKDEAATHFTIANRTRANAEKLAPSLNASVIEMDELPDRLNKFDIVVCSTGSTEPVVTTDMLDQATKMRRHRAMFVADLGVPRDVEAEAGNIDDVYLYTVDDLSKIISQNLAKRQELTIVAQRMVAEGVTCYLQKRRVQLESTLLANYRTQVDTIRQTVFDSAKKKLDAGEPPEEVLAKLAHDLSNQLAHKPTISIRQASATGNEAFLNLLKDIYELEN